ncbi:hypothetical protein AGDE_06530 [Angomonas deanei]|nr:hypothetical protein AGDE_06530 [Angomonas deanei]|eukprot:EPY37404.1 hypothetical protein AGDE_06530 [Angomonas deanei]
MGERSGTDSMKVADIAVQVNSTLLSVPLTGLEHRATEFRDTMQYIRSAGGPTSMGAQLMDNEGCRIHSGDVVRLPKGIAVGHGPRTNLTALEILKDLYEVRDTDDGAALFDVITLEQEGDAPPLGDYFGFAGDDILIAWKDEHGLLAVDQYQQSAGENMQVVYVEPGCHFFSFYGVDYTNEILVQRGFDRSMDSMAAAGLLPIPVNWSEFEKLGISMRSATLPVKFIEPGNSGSPLLSKAKKGRENRWQSRLIKG